MTGDESCIPVGCDRIRLSWDLRFGRFGLGSRRCRRGLLGGRLLRLFRRGWWWRFHISRWWGRLALWLLIPGVRRWCSRVLGWTPIRVGAAPIRFWLPPGLVWLA